jgi:hypothetical protein
MREQQRKFDRVVDAGIESGVFEAEFPHDASRAIASMCTAVATWYNPRGSMTPGDVGERYAELAVRMLSPSRR